MESKFEALHRLLSCSETSFLMEAHNGISAKIVEQTGFEGIWASGLSISAALGVRDNNEASWTQVLEVVEFMSDATNIPILLDGDTGYGNFNNVRRLVKKLEQRGVAGVCIEDKLFPKTNSFIRSEKQPLSDVDEFCGKISAAKDTQNNDSFCVVARVEALISGWGVGEALNRAESYRKAGADAVLIHSRRSDAAEIESFMAEWSSRLPVVIVPTSYYSVPTQLFKDIGVSTVIWANHNCRAAISAMKNVSERIFDDQSLINVEGGVVTVQEVFRLQGEDELREAEAQYLPGSGRKTKAIILAASRGEELGVLTESVPKTLLTVGGKSILQRLVDDMKALGIKNVSVVCGFGADKIQIRDIKKIENNNFVNSSDLYSLYCARDELVGDVVISFGDIVFKQYVLHLLLSDSHDISIVVDADGAKGSPGVDQASVSVPYADDLFSDDVKLCALKTVTSDCVGSLDRVDGEFIGLWKISSSSAVTVRELLNSWAEDGSLGSRTIVDLINRLVLERDVAVKYIKGSWADIDTILDLQKYEATATYPLS